jgi:hypothetical protein
LGLDTARSPLEAASLCTNVSPSSTQPENVHKFNTNLCVYTYIYIIPVSLFIV